MDDEAWKRLGEAIRERREDLGLTQEQAAVQAEVSSATWRIVETASRTNVRRSALRAICRSLQWSADSYELILAGNPPTQVIRPTGIAAEATITGAGYKSEPKALSGKIDRLTAAQRAKIEALVDEMLPEED